jgi:hypothetical protein
MALDPNEFDPSCAKRVDRSLSSSLNQQLNGTPPSGLPRLPRDLNDLMRMAKAMHLEIGHLRIGYAWMISMRGMVKQPGWKWYRRRAGVSGSS